ncbi:gamma-glutamyltranspeptidase / glutathione hydrolase [Melghirimyces thermohalophilus]|uniref:Gamma-glutamyltranspeptidase / glutathione hydrolase n=1 Tax=Melghirimyces thermohalophilus TaxID=1236220 RepID=A0A1G6IWL5_9BACL|nr:gamma-glutamyltransferase family protein [Melghirimyces thermohalophilus]SDC10146.1 gamma-glutamyltranspeptidase / glutathione hydrolase [Melghirimyces thermohalophilus]
MQFHSMHRPYLSQRTTVYAKNGMVATSQPLAAQAGLDMLKQGGNAIDAAIATAAALTVLEPTSNGIGGDAFALVWTGGNLHGLNASGPAPGALDIDSVRRAGYERMPRYGWLPVTVPGAPAGWSELSRRFGKLPLTQVLEPAARYAEEGYPLTPVLAHYWEKGFRTFQDQLQGEEFASWFRTFAPEGRAPRAGEIWRSADHARTLRSIAETDAASFYAGDLADKIDQFSRQHGGFLRKKDLESYRPEWVDPIHIHYRGYEVWEIPPNGQGLVALMALNILKGMDFGERETAEAYHRQIEAIKLAFADGEAYITEREKMPCSVEDLLSEGYAEERRRQIGTSALTPTVGEPVGSGTVYLAAADGDGNRVSFIQSNFMGFGSGLVVPGTGISLQNRGYTFSLDPHHANVLEPGKRTYHTIIPGFLTKGGRPVGPFGVMGGYMQPQGHVQMMLNTIDFGLNPQSALDAPRWRWVEGKTVEVERGVPDMIVQELIRRGHDIRIATDPGGFGRGQIIWENEHGVLAGGTEPRTDGSIAAW